MAKTSHTPLVNLVRNLASQGKYLSVEVHDARPDGFDNAKLVESDVEAGAICCKKWGYDPNTGERVCLEPC